MKALQAIARPARRLVVHDAARAVGAAQGSARRARQVGGARGALAQPRRLHAAARLRLSARRLARQGDLAPVQRRHGSRQGRSLQARVVDLVAARLGRPHAHAAGRDLQAHRAALPADVRQEGRSQAAGRAGGGGDVALRGVDGAPHRPSRRPSSATCSWRQLEKKKGASTALWALGRLGARVPLYGPVRAWCARRRREVARAAAGDGVEAASRTRSRRPRWRAPRAIARATSTSSCGAAGRSAQARRRRRSGWRAWCSSRRRARRGRSGWRSVTRLPSGLRLVAPGEAPAMETNKPPQPSDRLPQSHGAAGEDGRKLIVLYKLDQGGRRGRCSRWR